MPIRPLSNVSSAPKSAPDDIDIKKSSEGAVWSSSSTKPIEEFPCFVPLDLVYIMRQIERDRFNNTPLEFGLYLKGSIEDGELIVSSDVMLPPQVVSTASIDFDRTEDGGDEFNGVIHRHPGSSSSFSGTDDTHINSNFMFSLLYSNKQIRAGIINIPTDYGRIRLDLDINVDTPVIDISHLDLSNIKKRPVKKHNFARRVIKSGKRNSVVTSTNHYRGKPIIANRGPISIDIDDDDDDSYTKEDIEKLNKELSDYDMTWDSLQLYSETTSQSPEKLFEHLTGIEVDDLLEEELCDDDDEEEFCIDDDGFPFFSSPID